MCSRERAPKNAQLTLPFSIYHAAAAQGCVTHIDAELRVLQAAAAEAVMGRVILMLSSGDNVSVSQYEYSTKCFSPDSQALFSLHIIWARDAMPAPNQVKVISSLASNHRIFNPVAHNHRRTHIHHIVPAPHPQPQCHRTGMSTSTTRPPPRRRRRRRPSHPKKDHAHHHPSGSTPHTTAHRSQGTPSSTPSSIPRTACSRLTSPSTPRTSHKTTPFPGTNLPPSPPRPQW